MHFTFVMEMLEPHQGNTSISTQIGDKSTYVFAILCHTLKGMDEFMSPAHGDHGRCNMQNGEEVLDATCTNSVINTRITHENVLSQSAVCHTQHVE
jgi:hypothetical protein